MARQFYTVVAHDWINLEATINDLSSRVTSQELFPTSSPTFAGVTMTTLTLSGMTEGSVLFAGPAGLVSQDNTNFFWDDSGNKLVLGGAIELGHATDTTLARASAGDVNIEGNIIYRAGGTDVPVTDGGTGRSTSTTAYGLLAAGTTATGAQQTLAAGLTTQILVGGGTGAVPAWGTDIPTAVTIGSGYIYRAGGTDVPVGDGGTGLSDPTDHSLLLGSGASALTQLGVAANGQIPIGSTGADPVLAEITGTANQITSTAGAGTITLATPQDIHSGASPTFAGLTVTNCVVLGSNSAVFQPAADATSFFQVMESTGTFPVFNVDTTNNRVGFNVALPLRSFHVHDPENTRSDFQLTHSGTGSVGDVGFSFTMSNDEASLINNQPGDILFQTDNVARFAIRAGGNLVVLTSGTSRSEATGLFDSLQVVEGGDGAVPVMAISGVEADGTNLLAGDGVRLLFRVPASATTKIGASIDAIRNNGTDSNSQTNLAFSVSQNDETLDEAMRITTGMDFGFGVSDPETFFELVDTAPYITQHCSAAPDAESARKSRINFKGHQSGAEESTLARLEVSHDGPANDQKGKIVLATNDGNDADTPTPHFRMDAAGNTFIGDNGITDYSKIAADGEITLFGTARVEQFVESLNITGRGGSAPTERTTEVPYLSWTFNIGNDSHQSFEAPYQMDYTDTVTVKVHWYTSVDQTDDEVAFAAVWNAIPEAGGEVINGGGTTITSADTNCPTQWHIIETTIGTIAANAIAQDDMIGLHLERVALVGAGTDPTISTIHVLSIEFEYYMNRLGEAT